jgi:polar amino acid transport system substrate-binding protein
MLKAITSALLALFLASISHPSFSKEKIVVVVDEAYAPYMFNADGAAKGLYPDMIKAVFNRIGVDVEIKALPWARALLMGENGEAGIGGIYKNNKRLEVYDYSEPLFEEKLVVYVKKGNAFGFNGIPDLAGKRIGVNRAWSYGEEFDKAKAANLFATQEAADNGANFKKLIFGRIDCFIADEVSADSIIRHEHLEKQIEKLPKPAAMTPAYVVFAKKIDKKDLIKKFNSALADMKKDKSYGKLVEKFITETAR